MFREDKHPGLFNLWPQPTANSNKGAHGIWLPFFSSDCLSDPLFHAFGQQSSQSYSLFLSLYVPVCLALSILLTLSHCFCLVIWHYFCLFFSCFVMFLCLSFFFFFSLPLSISHSLYSLFSLSLVLQALSSPHIQRGIHTFLSHQAPPLRKHPLCFCVCLWIEATWKSWKFMLLPSYATSLEAVNGLAK